MRVHPDQTDTKVPLSSDNEAAKLNDANICTAKVTSRTCSDKKGIAILLFFFFFFFLFLLLLFFFFLSVFRLMSPLLSVEIV